MALSGVAAVTCVQIISVDFQNVTAGTMYSGQFEEKMKELLDEATKAKRKVILFLDELHRVIGAGTIMCVCVFIPSPEDKDCKQGVAKCR